MKKSKFTKDYNSLVPSWNKILDNLNYSFEKQNLIKHNCLGFIVSHDAHLIDEVKDTLDKLNLKEAHLYINLVNEKNTFGRHCDDIDVYFWQAQGKTKWIFDDECFEMEPGDLMYIPKGMYHEVYPLTPRAGISMSI
tara:strand:- start:295 stop:705 length:411 start_codon:yes stop_codon:yes gene_type:complete